ncbi:uncharacterized protein LOC141972398 isoform X1 [Athene noctua]|uniref:uncharacterized protein LOC141972398 isoform X1 n=1 Tax=Athene noctua TaxID=126797 RepID=UPI003EB90713
MTVDFREVKEHPAPPAAARPDTLTLTEEVQTHPGAGLAVIDLANAFFPVPLAEALWDQLAFTRAAAQPRCPSQNRSWKPLSETQLPPHTPLSHDREGILMEGEEEEERQQVPELAVDALKEKGWEMNSAKVQGPSQTVKFLGIQWPCGTKPAPRGPARPRNPSPFPGQPVCVELPAVGAAPLVLETPRHKCAWKAKGAPGKEHKIRTRCIIPPFSVEPPSGARSEPSSFSFPFLAASPSGSPSSSSSSSSSLPASSAWGWTRSAPPWSRPGAWPASPSGSPSSSSSSSSSLPASSAWGWTRSAPPWSRPGAWPGTVTFLPRGGGVAPPFPPPRFSPPLALPRSALPRSSPSLQVPGGRTQPAGVLQPDPLLQEPLQGAGDPRHPLP